MPINPYHIGFVDSSHLVLQRALLRQLPEVPLMVHLTFAGDGKTVEAEGRIAEEILTSSGGQRGEDEVAAILWDARYEPYRARRISGGLVAAEGLVPLSNLAEVTKRTERAAKKVRAEAAFHGFLADRSSVYLAPYILTNERTLRGQLAISFAERYHRILTDLGGHPLGLGLLATYNLKAMYGHVASYMRDVKDALDPKGSVNRGKLLGTMGRKPPLGPPEIPTGLMRRGLRVLGALRKLMPSDKYVTRVRKGR